MTKTLEEIEAAHMRRMQGKQQSSGPPQVEEMQEEEDNSSGGYYEDEGVEQELQQLKQQMSALHGRLAPAQQQSEEYRRLYQMEQDQRRREREELQEQIQAMEEKLESVATPITDVLTEDERDLFDPSQLEAISKMADAIAKRRMPKVDVRNETLRILQEREEKLVKDYRNAFLADPQRGLSDLSTLATDSKFQQWLRTEDNDDFDPLVNSFLSASSKEEVDRLGNAIARRVGRFKNQNRRPAEPDKRRPLDMQRRPQQQSREDFNKAMQEAKRLARSRDPQDRAKAKELLASI